jgi:hygromycin-B 7''-O-kinase
MHSSEPLLPPVSNLTDYILLFARGSVWGQAMGAICQRHGLPTDRLLRFGDGADPAFGSNVVFAVGDELVIKLFPPFRKNLFDADLSVAEHVFGKLRVTTPEIYTHGMLDGWPYIVMSRVPGVYLSSIWDTLDDESQLRIVIELAEVVAQLHAIPTYGLPFLENDWPQIVATRIKTCIERHREQEVSDYWLQQIPGFLAYVAPLYPADFVPAIVSGDIHQYHLLVTQDNGRWRLTGLFDFDDALIGFKEYDLAAAGLFMMAGKSALLRAFLLTYGYAEAEIDERLSYRLMAYTLLHRYRPFNWVREDYAKDECKTLVEVARVIYMV